VLSLLVAGITGAIALPQRLTAGPGDHFMGAMVPGKQQLVYVSNEDSLAQVHLLDLARGVPRLLFDDRADAMWPRPSPDGKWILYIGHETDAAGDVCIRRIDGSQRRCLTGARSAESQAIWLPGGDSIAVVSRAGLNADFQLRRIPLTGGAGEVLIDRNLASPAASPDGRWLVYVPIDRRRRDVGPNFLARASGRLELAPLAPTGPPTTIKLDLPGTSAFPVFSRDGAWLYFIQYLNDTNFDGEIDGNDNGVLFRVGFANGVRGAPEQLSSASWNCQYPAPAAEQLIATCFYQNAVQVYALPLSGSVPADWNRQRLDDELSATSDRWQQLLLLSRLAALATTPEQLGPILVETVRLHLELGEFESAEFYARRVAGLSGPLAPVGTVLAEIADHRRSSRRLSRGMLSAPFVREARDRLARLAQVDGPAGALAKIASCEVYDELGAEDDALAALGAVDLAAVDQPVVVRLYGDRAVDLYQTHQRRDQLLRALAQLADHPVLARSARLDYAQSYAHQLTRGASNREQLARLDHALSRAEPHTDIAFVLQLERALAELNDDTQEQVREQVFALYRQHKELEPRKALVQQTIARAAAVDNDYVLYHFANSWVSYVPEGRAERRNARSLFRRIVLERAYLEQRAGKHADARGRFHGAVLHTDDLEAHTGFVDMRLREGKDPAAEYRQRYQDKPNDPVLRYVLAYLATRDVRAASGPAACRRRADQALADVRVAARGRPQAIEVHHLWAHLAHQKYLCSRSGRGEIAVEANAHYLLALDLASQSPRHRASILAGVGQLQVAVGNYGIARRWLAERSKLPFVSAPAQLAHCLNWAHTLYHLAELEAPAAADSCFDLAAGAAELARFVPLVTDRSALYHLAAGNYAQAQARYQKLARQLGAGATPRNRLVIAIGRAAAALGAGDSHAALAEVERAERDLPAGTADHRILVDGIRAQAHFRLGQLTAATSAMARRRDGLRRQLAKSKADEHRLAVAEAEGQLALFAYRAGAYQQARRHLEAGLRLLDTWSVNTGTAVHPVGLALLAGYAELHLFGKVPLEQLALDLPARLTHVFATLSEARNPRWEGYRQRLTLYRALLLTSNSRNPT
jgi:cellulose synthase operon protein C